MKTKIILAIALFLLGLQIFFWWIPLFTGEKMTGYSADVNWCEENGGRWIDASFNAHCVFKN